MLNKDLMHKIKDLKKERNYTLYDLSNLLGVQVPTIERWLRTARINKLYAEMVQEKLNIK